MNFGEEMWRVRYALLAYGTSWVVLGVFRVGAVLLVVEVLAWVVALVVQR